MGISARHVRHLWAKYRSAGSLPTIGRGRPAAKAIYDEEVRLVLADCGSGRAAKALADKNINGRAIHDIMKEHGLVEPFPAKAKRLKW